MTYENAMAHLKSIGDWHYIDQDHLARGGDEICLDGWFSIDTLKAVVTIMEYNQKIKSTGNVNNEIPNA